LGLRINQPTRSKIARFLGVLIAESSSIIDIYCAIGLLPEEGPKIPNFGHPLLLSGSGGIVTILGGIILIVSIAKIFHTVGFSQIPDYLLTVGCIGSCGIHRRELVPGF
jgi:hypothetical protein